LRRVRFCKVDATSANSLCREWKKRAGFATSGGKLFLDALGNPNTFSVKLKRNYTYKFTKRTKKPRKIFGRGTPGTRLLPNKCHGGIVSLSPEAFRKTIHWMKNLFAFSSVIKREPSNSLRFPIHLAVRLHDVHQTQQKNVSLRFIFDFQSVYAKD
jgi:hypothetical protein